MTYKLAFNESALKEWKKLGHTIQEQFKKKLRERLENPRVPASQLHGRKDQEVFMEIMLVGICPCKARGKHEKNISRCYRTVFYFYKSLYTTS